MVGVLVFIAPFVEQRLDSTRRVLGVERFDAAWTEGCAMSVEAAVAYVRQQLRVLA